MKVLNDIGADVHRIYVVDDRCPEATGNLVSQEAKDPRIQIIYNNVNLGVGGATLAGMTAAAEAGADVIVKIDGDGQMDSKLINRFTEIILTGEADYAKGNRFFDPAGLEKMPFGRLVGNAALSFLSKISTGYWQTFDPTNGFIAIHSKVVRILPLSKISSRYFFESDMLFRLNLIGARVVDVPMSARYLGEISNMNPTREIPRFAFAHLRNFWKRIFYNYFLREFSLASIELVLGILLCVFGSIYGVVNWRGTIPATPGTVMLAALPMILGVQFLLSFFNFDIQRVPRSTIHLSLNGASANFEKFNTVNGERNS